MWLTLLAAFASCCSIVVSRPSEPLHQSQPVLKTLGQEIGSPSELAWQAWLLVESKGGISSALDSSNILRRITPKSIFIAPELISCPSGYSTDGRGSCRPDPISIDEAAQKQFFLKRLNAIYGKFGAANKKPTPPQGPLQFNIPISSLPAKNPPVLLPVQTAAGDKTQEASPAAAVVIYKLDNETKKQDEPPFMLGGAPPSPSSTTTTTAPKKVAEIVVEANDSFAGVVDYKIPNVTGGVEQQQQQQQSSTDEKSSEDSSPTVVLLLSSTKAPSTTTATEKAKVPETASTVVEVTEDARTTEITTTLLPPTTIVDEGARFETIAQTVAPLEDVDTTIGASERPPLTTRSRDDYERRDQQMTTTTLAPSTVDDETAYTDEDETEETQAPEQDSEEQQEEEYEDEFAEDELLKPGEAGTLLSAKNQELIRSKTHGPSTIPVTITTTTRTTMQQQDTTTIPPTVDIYEAKESTIKAEVTSFTTTAQTTDLPTTIVVNTVPIVVEETPATPRPQRVKATIQIDPYAAETRRQPAYIYTTTTTTTETPTEPAAFFLQRQPKPSFTVNDEPPIYFKDAQRGDDNNNLPAEFKDQLLLSPQRDRTYVRFPDHRQQPPPKSPPQAQRGYVRFPSDDVNSIHNHQDNLKDLSPFQYSSSTKSSVQRWRQHQKQQKPMLLRFWARMPLVRDLSFYPTTSHGSHNEPIGGPTPPPPPPPRRGDA